MHVFSRLLALRGGQDNGRRAGAKRCVQCSLPCVAMVNSVSACVPPARGARELTLETMSAKEAKNRVACSGKHLGYSNEAGGGLQCGLSGNSVPVMVTSRHGL